MVVGLVFVVFVVGDVVVMVVEVNCIFIIFVGDEVVFVIVF